MGRGEEREPEPGLVPDGGAHRPRRGSSAEGIRGDLEPRRRARRHGDRLPAQQDPGRIALLRAQEAPRLVSDHRRQYLPPPPRPSPPPAPPPTPLSPRPQTPLSPAPPP